MKAEERRLEEDNRGEKNWKRWGSYVSERAWGTVREDYSKDGSAWEYFPFDEARSKAYRWNEDGIAGICNDSQRMCFAVAFWNERDPFLKERLYGVTGNQGNHGEDVKEYYFYLDNTPTHSYMKFLYKYPQSEFPYKWLLDENLKRDKTQPEFELLDTGIFNDDKYFDIFVEYAKQDAEDICIKITAHNRGNESAPLHILPTVWFRNNWSWFPGAPQPVAEAENSGVESIYSIHLSQKDIGAYRLCAAGAAELLFTDNETNYAKIYGGKNTAPFVKDGINDYVTEGAKGAVNPAQKGTKAAAHYVFNLAPQASAEIYLRLAKIEDADLHPSGAVAAHRRKNPLIKLSEDEFKAECEDVFRRRKNEADEFYAEIIPADLTEDSKNIMRQALAGMLWSKQYYRYIVREWLEGDPAFPPPPPERWHGRNHDWMHLYNADVISMPEKWEYPWYAAWDLAFHCLALSIVDAEFAKAQLILLLREWYMHPNGQLPAYEWAFSDVNPPVHAWAALRIYKIEQKRTGKADRAFLERVFHKLLLNFTWWVNRKDREGNNVFEGGFLGLDNIGVFDRNAPLADGTYVEQSDGTSWMAMYCLNMMAIALELAIDDKVYEDVASKFFEHFVYISDAMNNVGKDNTELWNEQDGFYYDVLHTPDQRNIPLKVRSIVGLIPLFAVETVEHEWLKDLPEFRERMEWFLTNRPDLTDEIECVQASGREDRRLLALVKRDRLREILKYMLSEAEFLSEHGVRALSRYHKEHPFSIELDGNTYTVDYEPAESTSGLFGGNSNWRGPVWFPVNYLLIEALQKFDFFFGDDFKVEFPTGSGKMLNLWEVSQELSNRLANIFLRKADGTRAVYGGTEKFQKNENWRDYILFFEYFNGDNGAGLGASHQTGWTGLISKLLQQLGEYADKESGEHIE
ncbi:MAG: MGH1-like glycoside hydrolase domain-containing protein [Pyrinomonadaceae bacterium]